MARKLNIPKDKQIAGLRKAIANRKTPRGFIPSMKKCLEKLTGAAVVLFLLCGCAVRPAAAQTPVTIIPTQQSLATNVACTGSSQTFVVNNRNQTQHYFSVILSGGGNTTSLVGWIYGIDAAGNPFQISNSLYMSGGTPQTAILSGSGYYPTVELILSCTSSSVFSINYSGSTATSNLIVGSYQTAALDKNIAVGASAGATLGYPFLMPPFGNSNGYLIFSYNGTGPAGSTVSVSCFNQFGTVTSQTFTFTPVVTSAIIQTFPVPIAPCTNMAVTYTAGGASASSYILEYTFQNPGQANSTLSIPTHIIGTTATEVKSSNGTLIAINLNTSAAGTISVFDLATAACTGTPATNVIAVLTIAATENARSIPFNSYFQNGICVKASAVMDFTVGSQ